MTSSDVAKLLATYLRFGEVVNNQIKKGLLLSLSVNFFSKSVNIWQSCKQGRYICSFISPSYMVAQNK